MAKGKYQQQKPRPATTPEDRENQLIALAINLAEHKLAEGTASVETLNLYLKMASTKARLEKEMLEKKTELLKAQTEAVKSANRVEELYKKALEAMRVYSGTVNATINDEDAM